MSVPISVDRIVVKFGDGATPTEVFTVLCGLESTGVNETANTNESARRDCAKPFEVPSRTVTSRSKQLDVTSSGIFDKGMLSTAQALVGKKRNYKLEYLEDDGTDAGKLVGTVSGRFMMTARNFNTGPEDSGTAEVTLASDGAWTYAATV